MGIALQLGLLVIISLAVEGSAVGGWSPIDVNDEHLKDLAQFAATSINERSNSYYLSKLVQVKAAKAQVVAGVKYEITFDFGRTLCTKNSGGSLKKDCNKVTKVEECTVSVYERAWEDFVEVQNFKCGPLEKEEPTNYGVDLSSILIKGEPQVTETNVEDAIWKSFKLAFAKEYESAEEDTYRRGVFNANIRKVTLLQKFERGTATYGMTPFADLSEDEFLKFYRNPEWDLSKAPKDLAKVPRLRAPPSFDWRDHGVVTPVKNQGQCGSCWAFSTTGNIEGQWAIHTKKLVSLSEQELVDCDTVDQGCNGGLPSQAYQQIIKLGGLESETEYSYKGVGEKCEFIKKDVEVYINGSVALPHDEGSMATWLSLNGPISIGLNANMMQFYMGGISHPWKILCNPKSLDHGVLIVGYGEESGTPYWIIKNSWGASWGEKGYYRLYRGDDSCGVAEMPTSAVIH